MTTKYKVAQVKFNGGRGALLCDGCDVIISYGFQHEDRKHYCEKCMECEHKYDHKSYELERQVMNERIKELAERAGLEFGSYDRYGLFDEEKFAELIIADCIDAVYGEGWDADYYTDRIREHFGMDLKDE
jgi:hypothetical protein